MATHNINNTIKYNNNTNDNIQHLMPHSLCILYVKTVQRKLEVNV